MKKYFTIIMLLLFSTLFLGLNFEELKNDFVNIQSYEDLDEVNNFIQVLEEDNSTFNDSNLLALLADSYREKANWSDNNKEEYYEEALQLAKDSIKIDDKNGYAFYVAAASIGQLAQFKGIVTSLFMLGDFDHFLKYAEMYGSDIPGVWIALGLRYRDTPWPLNNFGRSEKYLKTAISTDPAYPSSYMELITLYEKWNKKDEMHEIAETLLELPIDDRYVALHERAQEMAQDYLK